MNQYRQRAVPVLLKSKQVQEAKVSTVDAVQDIRMGRISPWCTFATDQGSRLIDRFEPGQVQTLIDYIEPLSWKARVKRQQSDADWVQEVFNKAEIK